MNGQRTVHGVWQGNWVCDVSFGDFDLRVDEPLKVPLGSNQGPQPTDLLLGAVSSCFTLAVAFSARKRGIELSHLLVDATGTYDGPGFSSIRIEAAVGCEQHELQELLESAERVCYVTNTLRGGVELIIEGSVSTV